MIIAVDFDETFVYSKFPKIEGILPNAKEVVNYLHSRGHDIIFNSCRNGVAEKNMRGFLKYNDVKYSHINENSPRMIRKYGSDTRKISCDLQIDDRDFLLQQNMIYNGKENVQEYLWRTVDQVMPMVEKPLIICIVGESGTGKTMISNYFQYQYGVNMIESYTDRPKRHNNEGGHTFVSEKIMDDVWKQEKLAETIYGGYRYCCLTQDITTSNTYVIDEHGLKMLIDKWHDDIDIYSIRVHRDKENRIRDVGQERVDRDAERFTLPDSYFDYVIHNVTDDKQYVYDEIDNFVKHFRFENRFKSYELQTDIEEDGEDNEY